MSDVNPEIPKTLESKVKDGSRRGRRRKPPLLSAWKPKQRSTEAVLKPEGNAGVISTKCSDENGASMLKKKKNKSKGKEMKDFAFWCEMCKVGADHENVMEDHKKGKKHLMKLPQKEPAKVDHSSLILVKKKANSFPAFRGIISSIFDKAVQEPTYCPIFAQLFSHLIEKVPPFTSDESGGGEITVLQVLVDVCHETFLGSVEFMEELRQQSYDLEQDRNLKLRALGIIRVIGELINQKILSNRIVHNIVQELLGDQKGSYPVKENVEALCKFLSTIGKQLDGNQVSRCVNDMYLNRLASKPSVCPRLRFMIHDILDSHRRNWIRKHEEVKAETITDGAMLLVVKGTGDRISGTTGAPLPCSTALSVQRTCRWRRNSLPEELVASVCILCLVIILHYVLFTSILIV